MTKATLPPSALYVLNLFCIVHVIEAKISFLLKAAHYGIRKPTSFLILLSSNDDCHVREFLGFHGKRLWLLGHFRSMFYKESPK
jgi:hypothetical protein